MKVVGTVLVIILSVFMASQAAAKPFWVDLEDPPPNNITWYNVEVDGVENITTFPCHYDFGGLSAGPHTIRTKAGNAMWENEWSDPFPLNADIPSVRNNMGLSAE